MTDEQKEWIKVNSMDYTIREMEAKLGVSYSSIHWYIYKNKLPFEYREYFHRGIPLLRHKAKTHTAKELAVIFNVSYTWVRITLSKHNIKAKSGRFWRNKKHTN